MIPRQPARCSVAVDVGAFELIHGWGLEAFYDLRDLSPADAPVGESTQIFSDLDDPALLGQSAPLRVGPDGGKLLTKLSISGLHCAACVWLLEKAPEQINGWQSCKINYHARTIDVLFDPALIKLSDMIRTRNRIRGKINSLSATGRLQGIVMVFMPWVMGLAMFILEPVMMRRMFTNPLGQITLVGIAGLEFVGWLVIRRLVSIDV